MSPYSAYFFSLIQRDLKIFSEAGDIFAKNHFRNSSVSYITGASIGDKVPDEGVLASPDDFGKSLKCKSSPFRLSPKPKARCPSSADKSQPIR